MMQIQGVYPSAISSGVMRSTPSTTVSVVGSTSEISPGVLSQSKIRCIEQIDDVHLIEQCSNFIDGNRNMLGRTPLSLARLIVISIWKSNEHPLLHLHTPNNGMDGTFSISMQRIITCRQLLQVCDNFVGDFWLQKLRFNVG